MKCEILPYKGGAKSRLRTSLSKPHDKKILLRARWFSYIGHSGQKRYDGEGFFKHPQGVFDILYKECGIRNTVVLATAYLHDIVEDSTMFGDPKILGYADWNRRVRNSLSNKFGRQIANYVLDISKPYVDKKDIKDKKESFKKYRQQLMVCETVVLLVKMADRLHNLRTMQKASRDMVQKQVAETEEICMPIFKRALKDYPKEASYLIKKINHELLSLRKGLPSNFHINTRTDRVPA